MPTYFQKPENALKRANEFIDVGKKERALDSLYDVIKSKKHRTWQVTHEPIMEQYLQLCVELRKSNVAKEGLYQYKNICQAVNINSLVNVVKKYITLAEEKTEAARRQSKASVVDIDDLDAPESPESILLKAVSGENTQARADRTILMPWVKFLWESYRQCLDLLRNNSRVETLYQDIAQQAFRFCLKYSRSTEFRKLCDNLRNHLQLVYRHQHPQTAINLNNPESQAMHLETRLAQLASAIKMELWQEAFKAVEDIHSLIALSKKSPKPSLMANYYQKLSLVFWKSGSLVFHACSLHRLFSLLRDQRKNITQQELQVMAEKLVCATLAIPIEPAKNAIDKVLELDEATIKKDRHLATLLMMSKPPGRQDLLHDLVKNNVLSYLRPELQALYNNLEVKFHPLTLYAEVKASLDFITSDDGVGQYAMSLEDVIITRAVKQVSQVYQSIQFDRLMTLLPFATQYRLERVIVLISKTLEMQIRIDHSRRCITFGTDLMVSQREDVAEGPFIQSMPSENIRNQLSTMAKALHKAMDTIEPRHEKPEHIKMKEQIVSCYRSSASKEHTRLLQRRQIIEDRKEQLEHFSIRKEEEELKVVEEQKRKVEHAERVRREAEAGQREKQRRLDESESIRKRHAQDKMKELKQSDIGVKVLKNLDEAAFEDMTVEDIMEKQVEQLEKERKLWLEKLKAQEKKIDYNIRARRLVEIPLLTADYEERKVKDKDQWEKQEHNRIEALVTEKKLAEETRERLVRMAQDKDAFMKELTESRQSVFKDKVVEFEKKLAEERIKLMAARKERRKQERRQKWLREKEEMEQMKRDEQLKKEHEEKEEEERVIREEEEKEYVEKQAKLIETQKGRVDEEGESHRDSSERPARWQPVAHSGGWRDRVQQHEAVWSGNNRDTEDGQTPESDKTLRDWRSQKPAAEENPPQQREWRDNRGPDDRTPNAWRDRQAARDDRGSNRDDRGPVRDERGPYRDERGPARDDRGPSRDDKVPLRSWRDEPSQQMQDERPRASPWGLPAAREDRGLPPRDDRGPPPREDRGPPPREDRGPSLREDRGPPPRDDRWPPARDDRGSSYRDEQGPSVRDDRRPASRDDGAPPYRGPSRDGPPPRDDREPLQRDWRSEHQPAPREDRWKRDDARSDDRWRRDDRRDDGRDDRRDDRRDDGRDDRRDFRRDDRGDDRWKRDEPRDWRRDGPQTPSSYRDDRRPARDMDGPSRDDSWRRSGPDARDPPREERSDWRKGGDAARPGPPRDVRREEPPREKAPGPQDDDDGWRVVRH